jgi:sulfite reductase alpha subunit-like flavoprotein
MDFMILALLAVLLLSLVFLLRRKPPAPAKSKLRHLPIYFGSQTGTAERFVAELQAAASLQGFSPTVQDLNSLSLDTLAALPVVLIVCSTQGKGDAPDNATKFLKAAQTAVKLGETKLNTPFAVFGLGSLEYMDTFNKCSKGVRDALLKLGAREVLEPVFGDETLDLHEDFTKWVNTILPVLQAMKTEGDEAQMKAAMEKKHHFVEVQTNVPIVPADPGLNYERASEQYLSSGTL